MKKFLQICAAAFCLLMSQNLSAQENCPPACAPACDTQACPPEAPCDAPVNDCYCKYVRYKPCYYTTQRCVEEQIPCQKQCCRYVPEYYQVQRCRYVPQYYQETLCRQKPEYYCTTEYKTCTKTVCDQHCKYVPEYYWKHICGNPSCTNPCPAQPANR